MCSHLNKLYIHRCVCVFAIFRSPDEPKFFFGILLAGKLLVSVHLLSKWRHYYCIHYFFFGGEGDLYDQHRGQLKCDGTRAETRFRLLAKWMSPFKSAGGLSSVAYWQPRCVHQLLLLVVMLDTPCSEVERRVLATCFIHQFPLHFPSRASPCAITFQLESTIGEQFIIMLVVSSVTISMNKTLLLISEMATVLVPFRVADV
jgi:hypothetical protein